MLSNSQKRRRNYSRQFSYQTKTIFPRSQKSELLLNNYETISPLKEKTLNRSIIVQQPAEYFLKKKQNTPQKLSQNFGTIEAHISSFNNKIKNLLKNEDGADKKENSANQGTTSSFFQKSRSAIFKRSEMNFNQFMDPITTSSPYFIQCLKRKSKVATQACMHIHNSMLTFKQYLGSSHFAKSQNPDTKIPPQITNRKTIVFDMDETLIHTSQITTKDYQIKVPFKSLQGKIVSGYVNVRPHAKEIIKKMSRYCDIIVFTAGNQCYADPILDYLDPQGCIQHRLYRQSCTMLNNQMFVKDLRILGRRLQNVVLVDNAPHSYMLQLENGVPILNYMKGKQDDQLIKLQNYLMSLLNIDDVRVVNSQTFRLGQYVRFETYGKLIQALYGKWL